MKKLAGATVFAVVLAAVIFVVAVLPAEYGIDPLGTGSVLGLTNSPKRPAAGAPQDLKALAEAKPTPIGNKQLSTPPVLDRTGTADRRPDTKSTPGSTNSLSGGQIEFKYQIKQGHKSRLLVAEHRKGQVRVPWRAERRPGRHVPKLREDDKEGTEGRDGSFTAPFSGIHGWYWENFGTLLSRFSWCRRGFTRMRRSFRRAGITQSSSRT